MCTRGRAAGGGALLRLDHRTPWTPKVCGDLPSPLGQRYATVSAVWGSPHAACALRASLVPKPKTASLSALEARGTKNKKDKERKEKCEITFPSLEARGDARWSPPPGSARSTHVRCRRIRLQLLPSSADAEEMSIVHRPLCCVLTARASREPGRTSSQYTVKPYSNQYAP